MGGMSSIVLPALLFMFFFIVIMARLCLVMYEVGRASLSVGFHGHCPLLLGLHSLYFLMPGNGTALVTKLSAKIEGLRGGSDIGPDFCPRGVFNLYLMKSKFTESKRNTTISLRKIRPVHYGYHVE